MNSKVDFTKTQDPALVLQILGELEDAPPLSKAQSNIARDVLASYALNNISNMSGLDAVRLGVLLAGREKL